MAWLEQRAIEGARGGPLQTMYRIDGGHELPEEVLGHLDGYRGSRPVRVGNAAAGQLQLDIYGELMDAVYLYNKYGDADLLRRLEPPARAAGLGVRTTGSEPDDGIWEVRGGRQQFVYSQGDVLGGARPGAAAGGQARPAGGPAAAGRGARPRSTRTS